MADGRRYLGAGVVAGSLPWGDRLAVAGHLLDAARLALLAVCGAGLAIFRTQHVARRQ